MVTLSLGSILCCHNMLYFWTAQILSTATFDKVRNYFNMDIVSRWLRCVEASLWKTCHLNKQRVRRTDLLEVRAIEKFIWSILACLQIRRKYQWCWARVFYIGAHLLGLKSWNCSVLLLLGEGQKHSPRAYMYVRRGMSCAWAQEGGKEATSVCRAVGHLNHGCNPGA